jgi:hypothetical protein
MDSLTFVAKLVEFLAWPTATVVLVSLLRDELRRLLSLVKKLKAGPVEAEFEREVIQLRESTPPAPPPTPAAPELAARKASLVRIAEVSPRSAILEAWREVEAATLRLAEIKPTGVSVPVPSQELKSPALAIRVVSRAELIPSDWIARYYELRELRNRAAHDHDFTPTLESAIAYIELASRLQARLEAAVIGG